MYFKILDIGPTSSLYKIRDKIKGEVISSVSPNRIGIGHDVGFFSTSGVISLRLSLMINNALKENPFVPIYSEGDDVTFCSIKLEEVK